MSAHEKLLSLVGDLIRKPSVTPEDAGCQALIADLLGDAGFRCEKMNVGNVSNLWARFGERSPVLCFAGHTDVVPAGDIDRWHSDPFEPHTSGDTLFGRGAADMKGGLAAMLIAGVNFVRDNPDFDGSLAFLITSDEEGPARDGTRAVIEKLGARNETIDWCVVGEPSSNEVAGDQMRVGRRGSLSGRLTVRGIQGHSAYPEKLENPITRFAPLLLRFCEHEWDQGGNRFPPTSFQFVSLDSRGAALNVTPGLLTAAFNLRFSDQWSYLSLEAEIETLAKDAGVECDFEWIRQGEPFLTDAGALIDASVAAIEAVCGVTPELSTGGGTSDGRFIAPSGAAVVEIGPVNASIHQVNEHVSISDLQKLADVYSLIAHNLLANR